MKYFLLILFSVLSATAFSQKAEITLLLKDAETNLPIEDATVYVLKTKQTLLSNSLGEVTFVLNGISNIQVTHASYIKTTLRSSVLKDDKNTIYLKNNVTNIDEIIITKQHPQKILKSVVENSIKKLTVPARLKVYCREFFKLNGTNSYYNDGLMNFQISGKEKNFNTNILVEQNRSFGLIDENISEDLLGYNLNDIMENYYNFKYLNPILDLKAKKEFDFLIKAYPKNEAYHEMLITPLENAKGLLDDFRILYDSKKKIIIEVSSFISPETLSKIKDKSTNGSKNIYKSSFKTIYRFDNSSYYLLSSKEEIGFEKISKKKSTDIEVRNYLVTTNFSNQNYSFKDSEVFKDKTLFNKKNVILSNYWNTSGLTSTEEEQKIIESIEDGLLDK